MYIATDNYSVDIHTFPDGEEKSILSRFTGDATCVAISESGFYAAAGSRLII